MSETISSVGAPDPRSGTPIPPGTLFRGLLVHRVLGEGFFGYAYLASHPELAMPVVLKTFKSEQAQRYLQEARLAARAASSHVVPVLDAGIEDGVPFLVQRHIDGIDVRELRGGFYVAGSKLAIGVVGRLLTGAARGLQALHDAGVVHRDIKLDNMFLSGEGTIVIGDFGIALDTDDQAHEQAVGHPPSMPPEQWRGGPLDGRVDIYALGVAAHVLMTGELPFPGDSPETFREAHERAQYIAPPTTDATEAEMYSIIARMLRKDPAERYATAGAIIRALAPLSEEPFEYIRRAPDSFAIGPLTLTLSVGDLARAQATVIVHDADTRMGMDTGVAASLRARGGALMVQHAMEHAPASLGTVAWTSAGALDAQWVVHMVSAIDGSSCLGRCMLLLLLEAEVRSVVSLALPALGIGGGVPMSLSAKRMLDSIRTFASLRPTRVRYIQIVLPVTAALEQWRMVLDGGACGITK